MNARLSIRGLSTRFGLVALVASSLTGITQARAEFPMACSSKVMVLGSSTVLPFGVAVVNSADAWAVGYAFRGGNQHAFIDHWDGTSWSLVQSLPDPGSQLSAVAAVTSDDVWAVGGATGKTLVEHWDGVSWTRVDVPGALWGLNAISVLTPDDIWAVGGLGLRVHWDGTSWAVVPGSNQAAELLAVSMASSSDVWDVGSKPVGELVHPVSDHWDGTRWSALAVPHPESDGRLLAVVNPGGHVLALGGYFPPALVYQLDGTGWRISYTFADNALLDAMVARSQTDIWAVGGFFNIPTMPAVFHYDGITWTQVSIPSSLTGNLTAVALGPVSGEVWSVGSDGTKAYALRISCH